MEAIFGGIVMFLTLSREGMDNEGMVLGSYGKLLLLWFSGGIV
jgi:hypothetical protein